MSIIEKISGMNSAYWKNRERKKAIYKAEYEKKEAKFIRRSARNDLKRKYSRPQGGWIQVPKPGQRTKGDEIFEALGIVSGTIKKKESKK